MRGRTVIGLALLATLAVLLLAATPRAGAHAHRAGGGTPVSVPNLHRDTLAKARSVLHRLHLRLGRVTHRRASGGTVVWQLPKVATHVRAGARVNVVLG